MRFVFARKKLGRSGRARKNVFVIGRESVGRTVLRARSTSAVYIQYKRNNTERVQLVLYNGNRLKCRCSIINLPTTIHHDGVKNHITVTSGVLCTLNATNFYIFVLYAVISLLVFLFLGFFCKLSLKEGTVRLSRFSLFVQESRYL